jgi:hypothetical protein
LLSKNGVIISTCWTAGSLRTLSVVGHMTSRNRSRVKIAQIRNGNKDVEKREGDDFPEIIPESHFRSVRD